MKTQKGGWGTAAFVFTIIAIIFAALPLLSPWLLMLAPLTYPCSLLGIILGIVAIIKHQKKGVISVIISVIAILLPSIIIS